MNCPKCNGPCERDEVDIGVGVQCGPYGCTECGWSEHERYDLSGGKSPVDARGGAIDQFGGYHPVGSSMALAYRLAEDFKIEGHVSCFIPIPGLDKLLKSAHQSADPWQNGTHIPVPAVGKLPEG